MSTSEYAIILSTCKDRAEAESIATRLVGDNDAACVNIVDGITSIYRWQGKVESGTEALMVIKTRTALAGRVEKTIRDLSSYECAEVIVLPVLGGSQQYLKWLGKVVRSDPA